MIKKLLIILGMVVLLASNAYAGYTLYENEKLDLKIGFDSISASTFYNFGDKELLLGSTSSVVQWKTLNLDLGVIGDNTFASPMSGLSTDEPGKLLQNLADVLTNGKLQIEDKVKTGIFGSRDFNRDVWLYGIYAGIVFKFN